MGYVPRVGASSGSLLGGYFNLISVMPPFACFGDSGDNLEIPRHFSGNNLSNLVHHKTPH